MHSETSAAIAPTAAIYAISSGTISYIGPVAGYGGLILEKINNEDITALYGHLKLSNLNLKAGDKIITGQVIAYLGDAFNTETGGERKHLHFGIYKGQDLYFKGYENIYVELSNKWLDPLMYLENKGAILPAVIPNSIIPQPTIIPLPQQNKPTIFDLIFLFLRNIFSKI